MAKLPFDRDEKSKQAKGGEARARKLSDAERSSAARNAAEARWGRSPSGLPRAIHGSEDRPLRLGEVAIPCYVLDDGRRVLSQRAMKAGIGMSTSGGTAGAHRMAHFVRSIEAKGIDTKGLSTRISTPFQFVQPQGGVSYGYEASILPELCNVVAEARRLGKLHAQQAHIANQCEVLIRALANIGIISLVDEVTGYQDFRARNALAEILEAFVAKELQKWVGTFSVRFYQGIFRLWGWPFDPLRPIVKRPGFVGQLTNKLVYERLAPGVLKELQRVNPTVEPGRRAHKHHQYLTPDFGHPKLQAHITAVVALMDISETKDDFLRHMNKALPLYQDMPLFEGAKAVEDTKD